MATERVLIGEKHIKAAIKMAQTGEAPEGGSYTYSDIRQQGLRLIVQKGRATWVLKVGNFSKSIGYAHVHPVGPRMLSVATDARNLAETAMKVLERDPELLEQFLVNRYSGYTNEEALAASKPTPKTWTLQQCADAMIEARTKATASSPLRKASIEEINRTLKRPEMKDLVGTVAALLTRGEVEKVRDKIEKACGISAAKKCVSNIRSILNYCCEYKSGDSGLDHKDMWWELLKTDSKIKARTRTPATDEIIKTLQLATYYLDHPLPGRVDGKHGVRDNVYAAMLSSSAPTLRRLTRHHCIRIAVVAVPLSAADLHHASQLPRLTPRPRTLVFGSMLVAKTPPPCEAIRRRPSDESFSTTGFTRERALHFGFRLREARGQDFGVAPDPECAEFLFQFVHDQARIVRQRLRHEIADERQPADTDVDIPGGVENARKVSDEVVFFDPGEVIHRHRRSPYGIRRRLPAHADSGLVHSWIRSTHRCAGSR